MCTDGIVKNYVFSLLVYNITYCVKKNKKCYDEIILEFKYFFLFFGCECLHLKLEVGMNNYFCLT